MKTWDPRWKAEEPDNWGLLILRNETGVIVEHQWIKVGGPIVGGFVYEGGQELGHDRVGDCFVRDHLDTSYNKTSFLVQIKFITEDSK